MTRQRRSFDPSLKLEVVRMIKEQRAHARQNRPDTSYVPGLIDALH